MNAALLAVLGFCLLAAVRTQDDVAQDVAQDGDVQPIAEADVPLPTDDNSNHTGIHDFNLDVPAPADADTAFSSEEFEPQDHFPTNGNNGGTTPGPSTGTVRTFKDSYDSVVVTGCIRVKVVVDARERVEIVAQAGFSSLVSKLQTFVLNGVLYVRPIGLTPAQTDRLRITVYINSRSNKLTISAGTSSTVTVDATSPLAAQYTLTLNEYPGGQITANVKVRTVYGNVVAGAGLLTLSGRASNLFLNVAGSGRIIAGNLVVQNANIIVNGSADIRVNASATLSGKLTGAVVIAYVGNPNKNGLITMPGSVSNVYHI